MKVSEMKKFILFFSCLCLSLTANAQTYRGSDADRMMYERMRQYSQQNSGSNTYVPQRSYNNYNSRSYNNNSYGQSNNSYNQYRQAEVEKVIQGVYVYNNQLAVVRLRYYGGKITHYSTSKDMMNREQWQSMYPDSPHPTNSMLDGQLAREYKYKVSVGSTNIYFNL